MNPAESILLACPECYSEKKVVVTAESTYFANTGDFFCHSVKTHDANSRSMCFDCGWEGTHDQLLNYGKSFYGESDD